MNEKSDVPRLLEQTGLKCHYRYEPTIRQTQLTIEIPENARLSNELSVLIDKLRIGENSLSVQQERLYEHLVTNVPPLETDQSSLIKPLLERQNIVIKIIKSSKENKLDLRGKKNGNLMTIVSHFKTKRLEELCKRINKLKEGNSGLILCAFTGIAGCGKSELAKAYAWKFSELPGVFRWRLDPDPDTTDNKATKVSYRQAYSELLYNFGIEPTKAYETETSEQLHRRVISTLWQRINQYSTWIVIFDNAGSYTDIKDYLPKDLSIKGVILITTQHSHFLRDKPDANFCLNQGLEGKEAIQLLTELSGRHEEDGARNLVNELDYSPLGIRIAGCYIQNVRTTFERYTQSLQTSVHERLISRMGGAEFTSQITGDEKRTTTLQTALQLSILKVKESNLLLFDALQYCGYLANENIPLDSLIELCRTPEQKKNEVEDQLKVLIVGKENYSLLSYDSVKRNCYLHRSTQMVIRHLCSSPVSVIKKVANVILELYPFDEYSFEKLKMCQEMLPHFVSLIKQAESHCQLTVERISLLATLGKVWNRFYQRQQALQCLQSARNLSEGHIDIRSEIKVEILEFIGNEMGIIDHREAIEALNEGITIAKNHLQPTDLHLIRLYNTLGNRTRKTNVNEALMLYQHSIEICEKIYECSKLYKLQLAVSYLGIGHCLLSLAKDESDYSNVMTKYKKASEIYQQELGESHRYTAITYKALATVGLMDEQFVNVGIDYLTSRKYLQKILPVYTEMYGPDVVEIAELYDKMSLLWYVGDTMEDWRLALEYRTTEVKMRIRVQSPKTQELILSYYRKGRILEKLGRYNEAKIEYVNSLDVAQDYPGKVANLINVIRQQLDTVESTKSGTLSKVNP